MLTIRRPTPTTVAFTVSTASPRNSITAITRNYVFIALRILIGVYICIALLLECVAAFPELTLARIAAASCHRAFALAAICQVALQLIEGVPIHWRLTVYTGICWLALRRSSIEESLLVVRGLGVQTTSTGSSWLATNSTRFIPTSAIQDILIHEAFKGFEVRFYMAIVVAGGEEVVVVFPVSP
jgi:phosphatidylinositol glycan class H protein